MVENATNQEKVHKKEVDLAIKRSLFIYYNLNVEAIQLLRT